MFWRNSVCPAAGKVSAGRRAPGASGGRSGTPGTALFIVPFVMNGAHLRGRVPYFVRVHLASRNVISENLNYFRQPWRSSVHLSSFIRPHRPFEFDIYTSCDPPYYIHGVAYQKSRLPQRNCVYEPAIRIRARGFYCQEAVFILSS